MKENKSKNSVLCATISIYWFFIYLLKARKKFIIHSSGIAIYFFSFLNEITKFIAENIVRFFWGKTIPLMQILFLIAAEFAILDNLESSASFLSLYFHAK